MQKIMWNKYGKQRDSARSETRVGWAEELMGKGGGRGGIQGGGEARNLVFPKEGERLAQTW